MSTARLVTVSVIVATYRRPQSLISTLEALAANTFPSFETIVVDQTPAWGPTDRTDVLSACARLGARHIAVDTVSLTYARNVGLREARGDIVIFCDDDVLVEEDYVAAHVRCYNEQSVGGVAGRVTTPSDDAWDQEAPTGRLLPTGNFVANFARRTLDPDVDFGMGCNMSFRKAALVSAGGFDERYSGAFYREEGDAFAQVKRAGWRVVFEPAAGVLHMSNPEGGCRKDDLCDRMISTFRNEALFFFNCMSYRQLPGFCLRLLRWMYATVQSHEFSASEWCLLGAAPVTGAVAHWGQRRDRLTTKTRLASAGD